jgi:hypothetical protein
VERLRAIRAQAIARGTNCNGRALRRSIPRFAEGQRDDGAPGADKEYGRCRARRKTPTILINALAAD